MMGGEVILRPRRVLGRMDFVIAARLVFVILPLYLRPTVCCSQIIKMAQIVIRMELNYWLGQPSPGGAKTFQTILMIVSLFFVPSSFLAPPPADIDITDECRAT
jgi:hypothetical protein